MLNSSDQKTIGGLLAKMCEYSLNPPRMHETMLLRLAEICETKLPCSLVRVAGFDTQLPYPIGKPSHIRINDVAKTLVQLWFKSICSGYNPIANVIFQKCQQNDSTTNFATASELLQDVQQNKNAKLGQKMFNVLIKRARFGELGYMWLKLPSGFIWVICLRRAKGDGPFTKRQHYLLQQFANAAIGNQKAWYIPAFDKLDASGKKLKNTLTKRQFETLHNIGNFYSRKECAKLMGVSHATIDRNVENILSVFRNNLNEFDGKSISQIIREIKQQPEFIS